MSKSEHEHRYPPLPSLAALGLSEGTKRPSGKNLPLMGKFRFQLLAQWISTKFQPCRVADVGGGKGLLAYLLRERGFSASVIDPNAQSLPGKYKDLAPGARVKIPAQAAVPRIDQPFCHALCRDFDLIVGLHAHGSNLTMIEATATYNKSFILLPCCVIDEPATPPAGVNWFTWLSAIAREQNHDVHYFQLNFKGQNIGLYSQKSHFINPAA